jgi:hypothetical protein
MSLSLGKEFLDGAGIIPATVATTVILRNWKDAFGLKVLIKKMANSNNQYILYVPVIFLVL